MIGGLLRRIERLETSMLPEGEAALRALTSDELDVALLAAARGAESVTDTDPLGARIAAVVEEIEAGIVAQSRLRSGAALERARAAVAVYRPQIAAAYVPAVTPAGEWDSLDTPRLMARRAALWSNPEVVRVLEHAGLK